MKPTSPNTPNSEKQLTYYPKWLAQLQQVANYHGAITDLATYVAQKRDKTMLNVRPLISKIIKGHHQASPEHLLIIQEWMDTQKARKDKK